MPFEEISLPDEDGWRILPKDFKTALAKTIVSASVDEASPVLMNIHCMGDKVESTDNERATVYSLSKDVFKTDFLIPATAARYLINYNNIAKYAEENGWIHFEVDQNTIFSCRAETHDGYPDLSELCDFDGEKVVFPSAIKEVLGRAGIFTEDEFSQNRLVQISIKDSKLKIRSEGENGWFEESVGIEKGAKDCSFYISPSSLSHVLDSDIPAVVGEDRILFQSGNYTCVIALEV